jgi:hypothetical protein
MVHYQLQDLMLLLHVLLLPKTLVLPPHAKLKVQATFYSGALLVPYALQGLPGQLLLVLL